MSELTTITFSYTKDGTTVQDTHSILVDKVPASLAITGPASVNEGGNAIGLTATVTYTDATTATVSITDWTSDNTASATVGASTGVVTSAASVIGSQVVNISCSYTEGGVTVNDSHAVTVVETTKHPVSAAIIGAASVNEGANSTYIFRVTYDDSSTVDESITNWSVNSGPGSINATSGQYTAPANVTGNQSVTLGGSFTAAGDTVNATLNITVVDTTVYPASVVITGPATVNELGTGNFIATVTYTNSSTAVKTTAGTWSINNASAGSIGASTGVLSAIEVSGDQAAILTFSITENGVTVTDTHNVTVKDVVPVSASISGPVSVDEGASAINFGAIVTYDNSSTADRTSSGTWSIDNATGGTINASTGQFTPASGFLNNQSVVVTFSYTEDGTTVQDTHNITVVDTSLPTSAVISGATTAKAGGTPVILTATVTYDDTTSADRTTEGTWSSSNPAAGSINPSTGVFTPVAQ